MWYLPHPVYFYGIISLLQALPNHLIQFMAHILIIEDDIVFSRLLESFLKKNGHETTVCPSIKAGLSLIKENDFQLLLLDYRLPDGVGIDVLEWLHKNDLKIPVVIMTGFNDIRTAVRTVKMGAIDYITKPVNPDELLMIVEEALNKKATVTSVPKEEKQFITGNSVIALQIQKYIEIVAPTELSVIIQGESGTGKEQTARNIHQLSKRNAKPFIAIDCGALSADLAASELFGHIKGAFTGAFTDKKGQFEAANGGTLFLDEIGNLSYEIQVKLLRALQEKEIQPIGSNKIQKADVRIVTATNEDLANAVKKGSFREDLYHRLNEFKIQLSPLRERKNDLQSFIRHFIRHSNEEFKKEVTQLAPEVAELFEKYDWPGNLRELKNIIKRAVLLTSGDTIEMDVLPEEMAFTVTHQTKETGTGLNAAKAETEKELIEKTLQEVRFNKSKAAKLLNIDRATLYYKMAKYGIEK